MKISVPVSQEMNVICRVPTNSLLYVSVTSDIPNIWIKLNLCGKKPNFSILTQGDFSQQLLLTVNKGITFTISSFVSLKLTLISQEELLKRMRSLWNMTQEIKNNLKQEASKKQSLEVRMNTFCLFLYFYAGWERLAYIFSQIEVTS